MKTLSYSTPVAKKEHRCNYCGGIISKGGRYVKSTHVKDMEVYTWKQHISCGAIAEQLNMYDECDEGLTGEDFREYINHAYADVCSDVYTTDRTPSFLEKLEVVKNHYLTLKKNGTKK